MGTWFPIGPDFVYWERNTAKPPARLSRYNEGGYQTKVLRMALDPTATPPVIYTIDAPYPQKPDARESSQPHLPFWPAGAAAFRSNDDGRSWTSISDSLTQQHPGLAPTCVAVHPSHGATVYLGTDDGDVFVSSQSGASWSAPVNLGGPVVQLVVDPRGASDPSTTTIYAATKIGLHISTNGGGAWALSPLHDDLCDLAFHMPPTGSADFYAAARGGRVHHTTDPALPWTLLSGSGSGLPAPSSNGYRQATMVEITPKNPKQVYVAMAGAGAGADLYASSKGPTGFSKVACPVPVPYDDYRISLSIAPDSPGDGEHDMVFLTGEGLWRSEDSGRSWTRCWDILHGDFNCIAFRTDTTPATAYVGCDGGLYATRGLTKPGPAVGWAPSTFNDQNNYDNASPVSQNLNHGKLSLAVCCYSADPRYAAYGYAGAQDTGVSGHTGTLGWRAKDGGDVWAIATSAGPGGLTTWYTSPWGVNVITDRGESVPPITACMPAGFVAMTSSSTMRVTQDNHCLSGATLITTMQTEVVVATPSPPPTEVTVTPASMVGIVPGTYLGIDYSPNSELVSVDSVTATTFTAKFGLNHAVGTHIKIFSSYMVKIDEQGLAVVLGAGFGEHNPKSVAPHPDDPQTAVVITGTNAQQSDQRAWISTDLGNGSSAQWTEIAVGKPSGVLISTALIDTAGTAYALTTHPVATGPGTPTPLFELANGEWKPQTSVNLPAGPFGCMVARPGALDTLYISSGADVFEVVRSGSKWTWTNVGSTGLPGQAVVDLWIGDVGTAASPKFLLRAALVSRGIWETDVTSGPNTVDPPTRPYFRHQALDQGWLSPSIDGQVDPFRPEEGASLYHWESPDIKVDAKRKAGYYQTDPEEKMPISHGAFDRLIDASESLPQSDQANVHVQVHNRSYTKLDDVSVWAIFCHFSGALPSLAATTSNTPFEFWSQFQSNGTIIPSLPSDSLWTAVGLPQKVSGLDVAHPQVASFANWTIPTLTAGDAGHFCMVVFAHSQANPINEASTNVDGIAVSNPQVAQRNLHVTTLLPMLKKPGWYGLSSFIEMHNPSDREIRPEILVDLRGVPRDLHGFVHLTDEHDAHANLRVLRLGDRIEPELHHIPEWLHERSEDILVRHLGAEQTRFRGSRTFGGSIGRLEHGVLHPIAKPTLLPHRSVGATIAFATQSEALLSRSFRFQVVQRLGGEVVGGATYWVRPRTEAPLRDGPAPERPEPRKVGDPWG